ncbi:MAG: FAD:protein FMN transferase [Sutterella sp.]|nr:FAD:protein FMN transferase [Sutterella sp.]
MIRKTVLAALMAAVMTAAAAMPLSAAKTARPEEPAEYMLDWSNLHMGTLIHSKVMDKDPDKVKNYAELVEEKMRFYDDMMSVHKSSPLNEVNRRSGEAVEVPAEIADMTIKAFKIAEETDGAFEPMIGPVVNLWKIGFGGEHVPSDKAIADAVALVDRSKAEVYEDSGKWFIRIAPGQSIDMGAIAKGYIGTRIAEILKDQGMKHGLLDLGGNVVAVGEKALGQPWRIGIQHPAEERGGYFAVAAANDESVVTSGAYERYFEEGGKRYSHILDPKTGRPSKTDIASVTIIDKDGARADALCTALFAMGWDKTRDFLRHQPQMKAVVMHADMMQAVVTPAAAAVVTPADDSVKLTTLQ